MSFIFQARPDRYDLRRFIVIGNRASWVASRYRELMTKGSIVYFWLSGDPANRGIYGWGEITGRQPTLDANGIYRVEVTYRCNFLEHGPHQHLSAKDIEANKILGSVLILRSAIGTNFLLSDEEDKVLRKLIAAKYGNECVPPMDVKGGKA